MNVEAMLMRRSSRAGEREREPRVKERAPAKVRRVVGRAVTIESLMICSLELCQLPVLS